MSDLTLMRATITIEFEVPENGTWSKRRSRFTAEKVEQQAPAPSAATLDKAILGVQKLVLPGGQDGCKLFWKEEQAPSPFNTPAARRRNTMIKFTYHLRDDESGNEFKPAVAYPVESSTTFINGASLKPYPVFAVLTAEGPQDRLVIVTDDGGPGRPECSGCYSSPGLQKRRDCAAHHCYSNA